MIPLEDFFRKPDKIMLRLSPGGARLAYLEPYERRLNVMVRDLATGETRRVTEATERDIGGFVWVSEDRLVYVQDTGGDENDRLYAVGHDGSNRLDLTPFDDVKCDVVDELEENENEILFQMNRRVKECFDVYRLNVHTGEMQMVDENPGNIQSYITDHDGRLLLATSARSRVGSVVASGPPCKRVKCCQGGAMSSRRSRSGERCECKMAMR